MTFKPITEHRFTPRDPQFEFRCFQCGVGNHQNCVGEAVLAHPKASPGTVLQCACRCAK